MDAMNLLKMILARAICDDMNCEDCKELFNTTDCPTAELDYDTRVDFVKSLLEKLNIGQTDLGKLDDINIDDLLKLVNEAAVSREEGNVDEPAILEDHPVDYRAIAEEIEMPF